MSGSYELRSDREVGFRIAAYDAMQPLTIDPVLAYSTYLGGTLADGGDGEYLGLDVDAAGNAYVTGITKSLNFPTVPGAFDTSYNGGSQDVYVAKLDAAGGTLLYSTYLGGSGRDYGTAIAVSDAGDVHVTGGTNSNDFPTTAGAFDTTFAGVDDAFVAKLNATGSALVYSTYLADGGGYGIDVDASGNAYVTGGAASAGFPTTVGAFDTTFAGGDAFITKLNPAGSALVYSTYLGGTGGDSGEAIIVDDVGNAYVSGSTSSIDLFTTPGAYDSSFGGVVDAFVAKLNAAGSGMVYSTYVGGTGYDNGRHIALDGAGGAYIAGETSSADFPTTAGAFDAILGGSFDAFVTKVTGDGSALAYSTYFGGSGDEGARGLALTSLGEACITGATSSNDFPATPDAFDPTFNAGVEAFLAIVNAGGSAPVYSTYLGGNGDDTGSSIAVDAAGGVYVTGVTLSNNFPTTAGAFDTTSNGGGDVFITKFANGVPNLRISALKGNAVAGAGSPYAATDTTKNFGTTAAGASATKFYISTDATWDTGDVLLEPIAGRSVPGIAPGKTNSGTTVVTIPAGTATAKRFLIAYADAGDVIAESSEADNTKVKAIYVGPDLIISDLTAPANAAPGQTISVTDTTENLGGAPTDVPTTTQFYLSTNKKLDGSDVSLGSGRNVPILAAGASSTAATNVTIPPGTTPGTYFILGKADGGAVQMESRETNNLKATAITVN